MGIIDTLSAGFDLVRRKIWLIFLPVILDIALWIAPKLSIQAMIRSMFDAAAPLMAASGQAAAWQEQSQAYMEMARSLNLSRFLSSGYPGVSSLPAADTLGLFGLTRRVIELPGDCTLLALIVGLIVAGFFISALYLGLVAQLVRGGRTDWRYLLRRLPVYWLRLTSFWFLVAGILILAGLPLILMLSVFVALSPALASMLLGFMLFLGLWVAIYLLFVPEAILFGEDGVLPAILHSIGIVRNNFWPTLGILALTNVITGGLMFIWNGLAKSSPGAILAIVGNAYIGTGLSAALVIFYRDRLQAWQTAISSQQRSRAEL